MNLVVHRDLKPSNILVTRDGTPRLIDFGIAKVLATNQDASLRDATIGIGPCTPRYCSPEQVRGEEITTAADIFSLGIILYELITRFHPFDPATNDETTAGFELLKRICEHEARRLSAHPGKSSGIKIPKSQRNDLEAVILKALQKQPCDRYKSVEHLVEDIENFLDSRPLAARPQVVVPNPQFGPAPSYRNSRNFDNDPCRNSCVGNDPGFGSRGSDRTGLRPSTTRTGGHFGAEHDH